MNMFQMTEKMGSRGVGLEKLGNRGVRSEEILLLLFHSFYLL